MKTDNQFDVEIGHIVREHGVRGFCKTLISSEYTDSFVSGIEVKLQSFNAQTLQTRLLEIKPMGNLHLAHFAAFANPEDIVAYRKAKIFLRDSFIKRTQGQILDHEWAGFAVFDADSRQRIGQVERIVYTPLKQFEVQTDTKLQLIPFVQDWIESSDMSEKKIVLRLPEGLIQL